eukprot:TRINITY_DN24336_c0_g1_i1.p1 TRINITY_DN24336_c0_g1~~TRINITY_DN24336_c0_g1_i1.p1  ORF type:complete len:436 (+),score=65.28 TRINITY_DN24336_c0_g1_i1:74-1381(+)
MFRLIHLSILLASQLWLRVHCELDYEIAVPSCGQASHSDGNVIPCVMARRGDLDPTAGDLLMLLETDADCVSMLRYDLAEEHYHGRPVRPAHATCAWPAVLTFNIFAVAQSLRAVCSGGDVALRARHLGASCDAMEALRGIRAAYTTYREQAPSLAASMVLPQELSGTIRRFAHEEFEKIGSLLREFWTNEAIERWRADPASLAAEALQACLKLGLSRRVLYWRSNVLFAMSEYGLSQKYLHLVAPRSDFLHSRQEVLQELLGGPPATGLKWVEIGVHLARLAFSMLGNLQGLQYVGVDPYVYDSQLTSAESTQRQLGDLGLSEAHQLSHEVRKAAEQKLSYFGPRAKLLAMPSVEAAAHVADASCDGIFIDGDHSYAQVVRDIAAWEPKVKPGGFLSGHDFGNHPDVARAVLERAAATNRTVHLAMDWVWYYYV